MRLQQGVHTFTYKAIDAFKNIGSCDFTIEVIDDSQPVIENCINQTLLLDGKCLNKLYKNFPECHIDWQKPTVYDNSGYVNVDVKVSLSRLSNSVIYHFIYNATDSSNNSNVCAVNNTLRYNKCSTFPSPPTNGVISCTTYSKTSICLVSCPTGFVFYDSISGIMKQKMNLECQHKLGKWKYDELPACAALTKPNVQKEVLEITLVGVNVGCSNNESDDAFKFVSNRSIKYILFQFITIFIFQL